MLCAMISSALIGAMANAEHQEAVAKAVARLKFLVDALDHRRDFSGTHEFPARIERLVDELLRMEPGHRYALGIKARMPELRDIAREIVSSRRDPA